MNCEKCGENKEGKSTSVYYAKVLSSIESSDAYRTTTTTTYGKVQNTSIHICKDCAIPLVKRKTRNLFLFPIIAFILFIGMVIYEKDYPNIIIGFGVILAIAVVITIIRLVKKKYKDISKINMYGMASNLLREKMQRTSDKTTYMFWPKYPSHLQTKR